METKYLLLDVGGTEIKAGIADENGRICMPLEKFSSRAKEDKETILNHFAEIISKMSQKAEGGIGGVGMAFPGPFDYVHGFSLMQGLDKYDSIYKVSLEEAVKMRVPSVRNASFLFLHDVEAFAVGTGTYGACKNADKIFCLCIGTGAGSAFIKHHKAVKCGSDVPKNGWIYDTPFKDSVIDDYLSVRGLAALSEKITGSAQNGRQLYEQCLLGDQKAMEVYHVFGERLKEAVMPFIDAFNPDAVTFGGQISGSFQFFGKSFEKVCRKRNIDIYLEKDTSVRTMQGLYVSIVQEG